MKFDMKTRHYFLLIGFFGLLMSCGSQKIAQVNDGILGSWEGCDGRVVTYTQIGDSIFGKYTVLARLKSVGFELDEVGYKLKKQQSGIYSGAVKWRTRGQSKVEWKPVQITLSGQSYTDKGSDSCSKVMNRTKN
jgi:hypothetical protein